MAQFRRPTGVAVDGAGNVYVADSGNHRICKVTPAGVVSTLAGVGTAGLSNGDGLSAKFTSPDGVAVDASGVVYVADTGNHCIRKVTVLGVVSTLAGDGNPGNSNSGSAKFNLPRAICLQGSNLLVADTGNNLVRQVSNSGMVTTLVSSGVTGLTGIAAENSTNFLVSRQDSHQVNRVGAGFAVSNLIGNGTSGFADGALTGARVNAPNGLAVDGAGVIYLADSSNHRVRRIQGSNVTTIGGTGTAGRVDGSGGTATFNFPRAIAVDGSGNLYVADENNHCIRKLTPVR